MATVSRSYFLRDVASDRFVFRYQILVIAMSEMVDRVAEAVWPLTPGPGMDGEPPMTFRDALLYSESDDAIRLSVRHARVIARVAIMTMLRPLEQWNDPYWGLKVKVDTGGSHVKLWQAMIEECLK